MTKSAAAVAKSAKTAKPRARRRRQDRGAEMRLTLLDAAARTIHDLGFARASIGEIVKRAGVTKGAHLHYFQTKEQLMAATIEYLFNEVRVRQERVPLLPPDSIENVEHNLNKAAETAFDWRFIALLEIWVASRTDPELHAAFVEHEARHAAARRRYLAEQWGEGASDAPGFAEIAGGVNFLLRGLFLQQILDGDWRADPVWRYWCTHIAELSVETRRRQSGKGVKARSRT